MLLIWVGLRKFSAAPVQPPLASRQQALWGRLGADPAWARGAPWATPRFLLSREGVTPRLHRGGLGGPNLKGIRGKDLLSFVIPDGDSGRETFELRGRVPPQLWAARQRVLRGPCSAMFFLSFLRFFFPFFPWLPFSSSPSLPPSFLSFPLQSKGPSSLGTLWPAVLTRAKKLF